MPCPRERARRERRLPLAALILPLLAAACPAAIPALPRPEALDAARPFRMYAPGSDTAVEMSWPDAMGPVPLSSPAGFPLVLAQDGRTHLVEAAPDSVNGVVDERILAAWFRGLDLPAGPVATRPPMAEMAGVLLLATAGLLLLRRVRRPRLEAAAVLAGLVVLLLLPSPAEDLVMRAGDGCFRMGFAPAAGDAAVLATPAGRLVLQHETHDPLAPLDRPCDAPPAWVRTLLGSPLPPLVVRRGAWGRSYLADLDAARTVATPTGR